MSVRFREADGLAGAIRSAVVVVDDPMLARDGVLGFQCFDQGVHTVAEPHTQICRIAGLYVDVQQVRAARCLNYTY